MVEPSSETPANRPRAPRIAQDFSTYRDIGFCRRTTTNWPCCYRRISSELHLAAQDSICAAVIHHEKNKVSCFTADLKAYAATFKCHHGGCAPAAVEIFAPAARHRTPAITCTDHKRGFEDRWENDYTVGFIEEILRNIFWNIQNLC